MEFQLPVSGDKVKPQQITALHLFCGLAFVGTGVIIAVYNYDIPLWGGAILIAGLVLLVLAIFKNRWLTQKSTNLIFRFLELLIAGGIAALSFYEQWKFPSGIFTVLTAAILFSLYWERSAGQKVFVQVDEGGIKLPVTSRRRFVAWHDVDTAVLKYGILSINCLDNKLYQFDVSGNTVDDEDFNSFCTAQVTANIEKRKDNSW